MKKKYFLLLLPFVLALTSCTDKNEPFIEIGITLLITAIGVLYIVVLQIVNRHKAIKAKKQAIQDALNERTNFTESKVIRGEGENLFYLATDDTRKKVFYVFDDETLLFDYKDVEAVRIEENGAIIVSKVSTGSALLGALIGEVVLGGTKGELLGAAAFGKIKDQKQISSMYVHVSLKNQPLSAIDFKCFDNGGKPLSQGNYRVSYELATIRANELYDLFQTIIDEVGTAKREEAKQVQDAMQRTIAAQDLLDNVNLYFNGQITDEEFTKLKEKILDKE